eukprot:gene7277-9814_t
MSSNPYGVTETFQIREVKVALIGMTGSGKSSFIKTFYEELRVKIHNPVELRTGPNITGLTLKSNLYSGEYTRQTVRNVIRMVDTAGFED